MGESKRLDIYKVQIIEQWFKLRKAESDVRFALVWLYVVITSIEETDLIAKRCNKEPVMKKKYVPYV